MIKLTLAILLVVSHVRDGGLTLGQAKDAQKVAVHKLNELKLFRLSSPAILKVRNQFKSFESYTDNIMRFNLWNNYVKTRLKIKTDLIHIIDIPLENYASHIFGGGYSEICNFKVISWSSLDAVNQDGEDATYFNGIAIAHEVAHLLGATHVVTTDHENVMDTNIYFYQPFIEGGVTWDDSTKEKVKDCLINLGNEPRSH